jgi:hypothetical protein
VRQHLELERSRGGSTSGDRDFCLLVEDGLNLRLELLEVGAVQGLRRCFDVLGRDALDDLDRGGAPDECSGATQEAPRKRCFGREAALRMESGGSRRDTA